MTEKVLSHDIYMDNTLHWQT
ncbi:hypothetical protein YPPY14_3111, partial [Yersinia pestis PY-14]